MTGGVFERAFAVFAALLMVTMPVSAAVTFDGGSPASAGDASAPGAVEGVDARIVDYTQDTGQFTRGDAVGGAIVVENTGTQTHTFFVGYSVVGPNGDYYDNGGTTGRAVTLDPGEMRSVSVSWTVESDAPMGSYEGYAAVWEESDRDNLYTRLDSARRSDAFDVVETSTDARVDHFAVETGQFSEGETVDARATVENTGNTEHTFFVGYSAIGPDGEYYDNDDQTGRTVTLAPGEQRSVALQWTVESGAPAGDYDAYTAIWEESDRDNLRTRLDAARRTDAFGVAEPTEIDARLQNVDVQRGEYGPGETVDARATVENTGNTEHTFFVGYSAIGPDGEYYDNDDRTGRTVTLAPGETRTVSLSWSVERNAPTGSYDGYAAVWKESDRDNLYTRLDDARRTDAFEVVAPPPEARIADFDVEPGQFTAGESVEAVAVVENTGETEHTFFVGYSAIGPSGTTYDNDERTGRTVTLAPGERRSVSLSWSVEDAAPAGAYDGYAAVWAESDRDNLRTRLDDARRSDAFEVVDPVSIQAEVTSFDVEVGIPERNGAIDAVAVVENTGNREHTFFVGYSVTGPDGETYDNDGETGRTVTLEPGERETVSLQWTVEDDAPGGTYGATAVVWRESDRDGLRTRLDQARESDAFELRDPADVSARITGFEPESGEYVRGDRVTGVATVRNTGNRAHTFFVGYSVTGPDGETYDNDGETGRTVTLDPGEERRVTVAWSVEGTAPEGSYAAIAAVWRESDRDSLRTRLDRVRRSDAFSVGRRTATVSGVVANEAGDRVTDATVNVGSERTTTDERGRYRIGDVTIGEHTMTVSASGYQEATTDVTVEPDGAVERVTLEPTWGTLRSFRPPQSYHPGEPVEVSLTVDSRPEAAGTYVVAIPEQDGVRVVSENPREVTVSEGVSAKQVTVRVAFTERYDEQPISAELRAPDGQVLDTASGATSASATSLTVEAVTERGDPVAGAEFELLASDRPTKTTASDGTVTFRGLAGGEYVLLGSEETRDAYPSKEVTVERGTENTVTVRFPATASFEGEVASGGEPLAGATVSISGESQRVTEEGEFKFGDEFETGRHEVVVRQHGEVVLRNQVRLHPGRNTYEVTVDPASLGASSVTSGDAEEVDRAELLASVDKGTVMAGMGASADPASDSLWFELGAGGEFWQNRDGSYHTSGPCAFYHDTPDASVSFRQDYCSPSGPQDDETHPHIMSRGAYGGFATGAGESVESIQDTIDSAQQPVETAQAFVGFVFKIARDLGLLEELVSALPAQIKQQQRGDNPYPADSSENRSYRAGWFGGYGGYQVATVLASAGAGKLVSSSSRVQRVSSKFADATREKKKRLLKKHADRRNNWGELGDRLPDLNEKYLRGDISERDLAYIDEEGQLSKVRGIAKTDNAGASSDTVWLERGLTKTEVEELPGKSGAGRGWVHILNRHKSDFVNRDGFSSEADIREAVLETVRNGNANPMSDGTKYVYEIRDGQRMSVVVGDNGYIVTAHPGT